MDFDNNIEINIDYPNSDDPDAEDDESDEEIGEENHIDELNAELENDLELGRTQPEHHQEVETDDLPDQRERERSTSPTGALEPNLEGSSHPETVQEHAEATSRLRARPFIVHYPNNAGSAITPPHGQPIIIEQEQYRHNLNLGNDKTENLYAPFNSRIDWEIAQWAKFRGASSTAFTDLMAIDGVQFRSHFVSSFLILALPGGRKIGHFVQKFCGA